MAIVGLINPSSSQDPAVLRDAEVLVPWCRSPTVQGQGGKVIPVKPSYETLFLSLQVRT